MPYSYTPLGDKAIVIEAGTAISSEVQKSIRSIVALLETHPPQWMIEFIPAFTTVTVFYDPCLVFYETAEKGLKELFRQTANRPASEQRIIDIPVCYGGEFGPDLEFVAKHNQLSIEDVIQLHTSVCYSVYMIGFAPGFPYLGGMPEKIAVPRKDSPRLRIPERSVGIAGMQTGIYPIETPGGWQLIGRTPVRLFLPEEEVPSLLRAGDSLVFHSISAEEYRALEEKEHAHYT